MVKWEKREHREIWRSETLIPFPFSYDNLAGILRDLSVMDSDGWSLWKQENVMTPTLKLHQNRTRYLLEISIVISDSVRYKIARVM
jgi:hypothetical protein